MVTILLISLMLGVALGSYTNYKYSVHYTIFFAILLALFRFLISNFIYILAIIIVLKVVSIFLPKRPKHKFYFKYNFNESDGFWYNNGRQEQNSNFERFYAINNLDKFYSVLGLNKNASKEDIKKAYRMMARKYHPDKYANASEDEKLTAENKFKEINEAYENLK